ncbi:MAG TPA: retropepsin-like aspartic protease [Candidatus Eisenbacteria bacterium]|jgi:clan AA aspartic protease (TIGR02281 family)|nr:retropepsin-like aspartic protease [Candidatus Eisenbacteria bacterium]
MKSLRRSLALAVVFGSSLILTARADTVYLADGRAWKGLIVAEDDREVRLDLGFDIAKLEKQKVLRIERSGPEEVRAIRGDLDRRRQKSRITLASRDGRPVEVPLINRDGHVFVEASLRGPGGRETRAMLLLDTGSSVTFLSSGKAAALGISEATPHQMVEVITTEGRYQAMGTVLSSIRVGGAEVTLMPVAVLQPKLNEPRIGDGLLGVSFLSRFNFKIDYRRNKLVLERLSGTAGN